MRYLPDLLIEVLLGAVFATAFLGLIYLRSKAHTGDPGPSKALLSGALVATFLAILGFSMYLGSRYL